MSPQGGGFGGGLIGAGVAIQFNECGVYKNSPFTSIPLKVL